MAILPIITAPDPRLQQKSLLVELVNDKIREFINDMVETMYHSNGVGLAAVQVGMLKRILIVDLQDHDDMNRASDFYPLFIVNPEIIEKSEELVIAYERCLSLPKQQVEVARAESIKLKFLDNNNNQKELIASGWLARVIQHEMDHLDGKLLINYLSALKKNLALRKLRKLKNNLL